MSLALRLSAIAVLLLGWLALPATPLQAQERRAAPSWKTGAKDSSQDWINTDRPISLADLKGKVVLLDFWTFG